MHEFYFLEKVKAKFEIRFQRDIFDGVNAQIARQTSPHRETFIAHLYPFMERIEWETEREGSAQKRVARPSVRYKQPLFLLPVSVRLVDNYSI